ncbi:DNA mismatch repair protein MutS [Ruminococcaceae bacterium OttesenSCG-928-L11]|nr:DNA mismatch repair protein MutS [Ruminococcaceae bacterium OttesenSCG-928-L11]
MQNRDGLTPMMQQYFKIKDQHRDHIVFYRLGDFYEMFFEDAVLASKELELVLTGRDCGLEERAPMCGIPHHSSETYIARLIKKGYKVAICEQMEDPAVAKGVVSREVIRVVTPGTLMENNLLEEDANNYLCAICLEPEVGCGMVFADISTGEMNLMELDTDSDTAIINELSRYMPKEVIFSSAFLSKTAVAKYMREKLFCTADLVDDAGFAPETAAQRVESHFGKSLEDLGMAGKPLSVGAAGALLTYLYGTQKTGVERLIGVNVVEESRFMTLDSSARANLELLQTLHAKEKRGSLLWVLDKTKTPMGKRLIKSYISQPLLNPLEIEKRLNAVEELFGNEMLLGDVTDLLGGIFDIERMTTRIVYGSASPREYKTLEQTICRFPTLKAVLAPAKSQYLAGICGDIDELGDVKALLETALEDEPPVGLKDGGVIRKGYNVELDELREIMANAKGFLTALENREREETGIKNLKIKFNKVFGYFLEVTNSYKDLVPQRYIRKQTLAGAERFFTPELKELEEKVLTASEKAIAIESRLFEEVRVQVACQLHRIQCTATAIARLDVFGSFARVSLDNRYVRPAINMGDAISISDGRHPVVEQMLDGVPFVPNDTALDCGSSQIAIITGPNMAGKSTYMRQVALIVLMAQIGCFVPAGAATIGVVDGIYTRIGASDDLTAGQSTFMVEMCEVAEILRSATSKSLLILDEIGRGTSTYDGMSIARAVIEYIAEPKRLGAKTLFATHYHELTEMENDISNLKNYNVAVKKRGEDITFLRKIIRGGADDSYGIEVSKLAGIPQWIIRRAYKVLEDLESAQPVREARISSRRQEDDGADIQIALTPKKTEIESILEQTDLNTVTPIEALTILYTLREKLGR